MLRHRFHPPLLAGRLSRPVRLVLAATCFLAAAAIALGSPDANATRTVPVAVVRHDLAAGQVLHRAEVSLVRWPRALAPSAALHSLSQAIGHRLAAPMRAGEPLVGQRLVGADLTRGLGPTLVAMSVPAADDRIGDFVDPGDRVDLYPAPDAEAAGKPVASAPVAEGVLVLAVLPASAGDSGAEQLGADGAVTKLVLAVQRADAGRLASANSSQKFTVVLDPP